MHLLRLIFLFFGLYITQNSMALASIKIDQNTEEIEFSKDVLLAHAPSDFSIEQYKTLSFVENLNSSLKLGYRNDTTFLRFKIENTSSQNLKTFLYLNTINGKLNLYQIDEDKNSALSIGVGGTDTPIKLRYNQSIVGAIIINFNPNETKDMILTINSRHNISSNIYIGNEESLSKLEKGKTSFLNFYMGGILLLVIYNFFLFLLLRDKVYVYYCFYALSFLCTSLVINGRFDQLFQMDNFTFAHYLICFSSISLLSAILFTQTILEIKKYLPSINNFFNFTLILSTILFFIGLSTFNDRYPVIFGMIIDITITVNLVLFIFAGVKLLKKVSVAKFYIISWICVLVSVVTWFGMTFGLLKINLITQNALPIGSMLEMLTLAFALAYKIEILNKEKISALESARDKEKYERLVRVLSHDVANSLTVVSYYSKKLTMNKELDQATIASASKISFGAENIKNILQIVREQETAVARKSNFELLVINVRECIDFSKILYEELLNAKNIQLKINIPNDLYIKADKTCFINNIVNNILSNAIKFSFPNSIIEVSTTDSDHLTNIIFRDYGVGIRSDLIHDIFFTNKVISSIGTNSELGHGLGTNLLREYMLLFEGKIQVSSSTKEENPTGHGTTIKLIFPHQSSL